MSLNVVRRPPVDRGPTIGEEATGLREAAAGGEPAGAGR